MSAVQAPPAAGREGQGLLFFGRISASVSHEIKNCLAIINESAGLLEDLAAGVAEERLEPARVAAVAGRITAQVQRADAIVKGMNAFAHSVDQAEARLDLRGALALIVQLSVRFAARAGAGLALELPEQPLMVTGSPFALQHALFACIELALAEAGARRRVDVRAQPLPRGARVVFAGLAGPREPDQLFARAAVLAEAAAGRLSRGDDGSILLDLQDTGAAATA